jgi:hypothetical protein
MKIIQMVLIRLIAHPFIYFRARNIPLDHRKGANEFGLKSIAFAKKTKILVEK